MQQTRVDTVVPYFENWMKKFPDLVALATAEPEEVNAAWAGLGYYRRARMLHQGAKMVVAKLGGVVPGSAEELLKVPGIGPYTAGAVASIAFGQRSPLVDGNVVRVFSRLRAVAASANDAVLLKACWAAAKSLVDPSRPGDFNQALMELGATVCTPKSPKCARCPVRNACHAFKLDPSGVTNFPAPKKKKAIPEENIAVCVFQRPRLRQGGAESVVEGGDGGIGAVGEGEDGV